MASLTQRANQRIRLGDFIGAEKDYRKAVSIHPNSCEALNGLGFSLLKQSCHNAAGPFLKDGAKLLLKRCQRTGDFQPALDLSFQLQRSNMPEIAYYIAETVCSWIKTDARAFHTGALALQKMNRLDEAYDYSKKALKLAPDESNAAILLASLESRVGQLESARERLQGIVDAGTTEDPGRACLELGAVLDRIGEYEQAFGMFVESAGIRQQTPAVRRINPDAFYNDLADNREFHQKTCHKSGGTAGSNAFRKLVFLVGFYRSGTTLIEQVLTSHPDVVSSDEAPLVPFVIRKISEISEKPGSLVDQLASLDEATIQRLRNDYFKMAEKMMDVSLSGSVFIDKTALNTINLVLIELLFPDAVVLFAIRDPRDVCISCFMQSFGVNALTVHFLDWKETANFYAAVMDFWLDIRDRLQLQWMEIRYEDIVDDLKAVFLPVFEALGLQWQDQCSRYYDQAKKKTIRTPSFEQVCQPIYRTSRQRWQNYRHAVTEIEPMLARSLKSFGYSDS